MRVSKDILQVITIDTFHDNTHTKSTPEHIYSYHSPYTDMSDSISQYGTPVLVICSLHSLKKSIHTLDVIHIILENFYIM